MSDTQTNGTTSGSTSLLPQVKHYDEVHVPPAQQAQQTSQQNTTPEVQETTPSPKKAFEQAEYWLNVGTLQGEGANQKLICLPNGIALDRVKAKSVPQNTKNLDFKHLREAEKDQWEDFRAFFNTLKPGESRMLTFVCEVRRVKEGEKVEGDDGINPYLPKKKLSFIK